MTAVYVYKTFHLIGLAFLLTSLAGVAAHAASGGTKGTNPSGRLLAIAHGVGLVLMLVSGFGMLARLGLSTAEPWVWGKILIWLLFGGASVLPYRSDALARAMPIVLPLIVAVATWLALFKPF